MIFDFDIIERNLLYRRGDIIILRMYNYFVQNKKAIEVYLQMLSAIMGLGWPFDNSYFKNFVPKFSREPVHSMIITKETCCAEKKEHLQ